MAPNAEHNRCGSMEYGVVGAAGGGVGVGENVLPDSGTLNFIGCGSQFVMYDNNCAGTIAGSK